MRNVHRKQQGRRGRARVTAGLMAIALGMTATVIAAPPRKAGTTDASSKAAKLKWYQIGKASWYGKKFQGHRTADGEKFDMNALTCAHRSLPMGSWIRVTNLNNHKTAFVRVNDRGPVPQTRILDLSYAAAKMLGIRGTSRVKIEQVQANDPALMAELVNQVKIPLVNDPAVRNPMVLVGQ